ILASPGHSPRVPHQYTLQFCRHQFCCVSPIFPLEYRPMESGPSTAVSRRAFLAGLAAVPLAAPRPVVVDTHMHVWTNDTQRFPFGHPYGAKVDPPKTAGTAELLIDEMDRYKVAYAILVQVIYYGWDNRYVA